MVRGTDVADGEMKDDEGAHTGYATSISPFLCICVFLVPVVCCCKKFSTNYSGARILRMDEYIARDSGVENNMRVMGQ